jgi:thermitase
MRLRSELNNSEFVARPDASVPSVPIGFSQKGAFMKFKFGRGFGNLALAIAVGSIGVMGLSGQPASGNSVEGFERVHGEYLVQLEEHHRRYDLQVLERVLGASVLREVRDDLLVVKRFDDGSLQRSIAEMKKAPFVKLVEPNAIYRINRLPDDPDFGMLWGLKNTGQPDRDRVAGVAGMDIGAERAWDITTGSRAVVVSVIDTGVDFSHPDLAQNAWVNRAEASGQEGVDDDGNGFVDDVHGWDFVSNRGLMVDDNGHGTHVAGTIGAVGNNGTGVVGVAWNVSLMAVKFLDRRGGGTLENAIRAIDYSIMMGATISNNSWGGRFRSDLLQQAVERSRDAGQLFVAAAGNDGANNDVINSLPASYPTENIVSVAALNNKGELASFSNFGKLSVDVAAPGQNIYSTLPNNRYTTYSGTSMAAPHVAGIAALLASRYPRWTRAEIQARLYSSTRKLGSLRNRIQTSGLADAYYALSAETPPIDPNDPGVWSNRVAQSISTPHPYENGMDVSYTVRIPGARRISVHFSRFETEDRRDTVEFLDSSGRSYGKWSGVRTDLFSPIVEGDTLIMKFVTDRSFNRYGFDVDYAVYKTGTR